MPCSEGFRAPVLQQSSQCAVCDAHQLHAGYLAKAKNDAVKLKEIEGKRFAASRFSGMGSEENLKKHTEELEHFLKEHQLKALSAPTYAFLIHLGRCHSYGTMR